MSPWISFRSRDDPDALPDELPDSILGRRGCPSGSEEIGIKTETIYEQTQNLLLRMEKSPRCLSRRTCSRGSAYVEVNVSPANKAAERTVETVKSRIVGDASREKKKKLWD